RVKTPRKHRGETKPSRRLRYIPAAVRRVVYERDGGRCRYVDSQGRRCTARDHLQFHHRHPYAYGGEHDPANISLMCRTHNAYLAEIDYGKAHSPRELRMPDGVSERPAAYVAEKLPGTSQRRASLRRIRSQPQPTCTRRRGGSGAQEERT